MKLKINYNYKILIVLFLSSLFLIICLNSSFFGQLDLDLSLTLDSDFNYTADDFSQNIEKLGDDGRREYLQYHLVDYLFITQYTLFLTISIILLLRSISNLKRFQFLLLFPLLAGLFDLLEGVLIDISLLMFPTSVYSFALFSTLFTKLKFVFLFFSLILILCMSLFSLIQKGILYERRKQSKR